MEKQKVFIPVSVEKEPDWQSNYYLGVSPNGRFNEFSSSKELKDIDISYWLKEQEGYFFTPEQANKIFGLQEAWPLVDVLKKLTEASGILLKQKNYDGHGWEEIHHATEKAKQYIESLNIK